MTNRAYQNGRSHEYRAKAKLEEDGWLVIRSAGSHSPVDLIAVKPGPRVLLVQCGLGRKTRAAKASLAELAASLGAEAVLVGRGQVVEVLLGAQAA